MPSHLCCIIIFNYFEFLDPLGFKKDMGDFPISAAVVIEIGAKVRLSFFFALQYLVLIVFYIINVTTLFVTSILYFLYMIVPVHVGV